MSELINTLEGVMAQAREIALVVVAVLAVIALAGIVYAVKTALGPLAAVLRWLFAYTPGERPNDIVAGLIFGRGCWRGRRSSPSWCGLSTSGSLEHEREPCR